MTIDARHLVERLSLEPHPEGGYYREVHRSDDTVRRAGADRAALTTIYFLLAQGQHSRWHVVDADEAWHFYHGDGLVLIDYDPLSSTVERVVLGPPERADAVSVWVVPRGHWQAAIPTGPHALAGCTVAPGFEFSDFRFVVDVDGHEQAFEADLQSYRHLI